MNLEGFKYVFNDDKYDLMINENGLFYDTKYNKVRENKSLSGRGYNRISIKGKYFLAHRVVKQTFEPIENYELYDVHHKDENKNNNKLSNLEFIEKGKHSSSHNSGSGNGRAYLTEEVAKFIKYSTTDKSYLEVKELVKDNYNIEPTEDMVYKIKLNKTWKNI